MDAVLAEYDPWTLVAIALIMALGGFVKGAIGFALPTVVVSGLASVLTAQETLGILIVPLAASNLWQTMRQGLRTALATLRGLWRLSLVMGVVMAAAAQVVPRLPSEVLLTFIGVVVSAAAALQLSGWRPRVPEAPGRRHRVEIAIGAIAGVAGALAGVWGAPVLFYLIACRFPKADQVRALGIIFLAGSFVLLGAHAESGVLNAVTGATGVLMLPPVALGMWLGFRLQDRLDQERFRRVTLVVLVLAGLNLLRRGLL
ncbi:MAG TPA: sulfite exporter TauE/SafE family protein [Thermohalobaculum sp.]|nr:sulfite exporter TauE/SafE family protein [Thermohalobaculum sp.]